MTGGNGAVAVAVRELRRAGRVRGTYLARAAFLLVLTGVFVLVWMKMAVDGSAGIREQAAIGRQLYVAFFITLKVLAVLLSPLLVCGAIADESENRTLEVLLTTPIGRLGLVTAKFLSRMGIVVVLLVSSLPVMMGSLALGGVAPREVAIAAVLVLGYSLALGAITVLFSALVRKGYLAALLTYATYLVWSIGVLAVLFPIAGPTGPYASAAYFLSPVVFFGAHLGGELGRFLDPVLAVPGQILFLGTLAAGSLFLASRALGRTLRRHSRREAASLPSAPSRTARLLGGAGRVFLVFAVMAATLLIFLLFVPGSYGYAFQYSPLPFAVSLLAFSFSVSALILRRLFPGRSYRQVWDDAFLWKEIVLGSSQGGRVSATTMTALVSALALFMMYDGTTTRSEGFPVFTLDVALGLALIVVSVVGGTSISGDREAGLIDLLLTTPAEAARIYDAKLWGTLAHLWPLALFTLAYGMAECIDGPLRHPTGLALGLIVGVTAVYAQAAWSCTASLLLRKSLWAMMTALCAPLLLFAGWPIFVALLGFTSMSSEASLFLAFQVSPFWYLTAFLLEPLDGDISGHWLGLVPGGLLHLACAFGAGYLLRLWSYRNFHRFARLGLEG